MPKQVKTVIRMPAQGELLYGNPKHRVWVTIQPRAETQAMPVMNPAFFIRLPKLALSHTQAPTHPAPICTMVRRMPSIIMYATFLEGLLMAFVTYPMGAIRFMAAWGGMPFPSASFSI